MHQRMFAPLPAVMFSADIKPSRHDCKLVASAHCAKLFACPCNKADRCHTWTVQGTTVNMNKNVKHTSQLCSSIYPEGSTSLTPLS